MPNRKLLLLLAVAAILPDAPQAAIPAGDGTGPSVHSAKESGRVPNASAPVPAVDLVRDPDTSERVAVIAFDRRSGRLTPEGVAALSLFVDRASLRRAAEIRFIGFAGGQGPEPARLRAARILAAQVQNSILRADTTGDLQWTVMRIVGKVADAEVGDRVEIWVRY